MVTYQGLNLGSFDYYLVKAHLLRLTGTRLWAVCEWSPQCGSPLFNIRHMRAQFCWGLQHGGDLSIAWTPDISFSGEKGSSRGQTLWHLGLSADGWHPEGDGRWEHGVLSCMMIAFFFKKKKFSCHPKERWHEVQVASGRSFAIVDNLSTLMASHPC